VAAATLTPLMTIALVSFVTSLVGIAVVAVLDQRPRRVVAVLTSRMRQPRR
jgi:hypothetical protein